MARKKGKKGKKNDDDDDEPAYLAKANQRQERNQEKYEDKEKEKLKKEKSNKNKNKNKKNIKNRNKNRNDQESESNSDSDSNSESDVYHHRKEKGLSSKKVIEKSWPEYVYLKGSSPFYTKAADTAKDIKLEDFSLEVPGHTLLKKATLTLAYRQAYGLIGRNGIGKSCLMRALNERDKSSPFGAIPKHITIMFVEQEAAGDDRTPLKTLLDTDLERSWLVNEEKRLLKLEEEISDEAPETLAYDLTDICERLREIESHKAVSRASQILVGLGFDQDEIRIKKTGEYSGGWRMRLSLAQALFMQPDLLILDEPTNHLDLHAVFWLEAYLSGWKKTLLLVSHEATFLNSTCNNIIHFKNQTLTAYRGDYYSFQRAYLQKAKHKSRVAHSQTMEEKRVKQLKNQNKMGKGGAKQAKSRVKQLAKVEKIEEEKDELPPRISFPDCGEVGIPTLQFKEVSFGYEPEKRIIFKDLDFGIYLDSRIGLVGMNGVGKSTLMKLMSGDLKETTGYIYRNRQVRIARFNQHHVDQLIMDQTPVEYLRGKFPDAQLQETRSFLGKFGLKGKTALQGIDSLSGGQKSRLVFAELAWRRPHILLLDEPTNHLDIDTVEVLIDACADYTGGICIISHHQRLLERSCKQLWIVNMDGTIDRFEGDFVDYKKKVTQSMVFEDSSED